MNILNKNCDGSCDQDNSYDTRFTPLNGDVSNIFHPCASDCREPACDEILEGTFPFVVEDCTAKRIRNLCDSSIRCDVIDDNTFDKNNHIKKSFPIYRVSSEVGCDEIVGAVWRTTSGNKSSFTVEQTGEYYVKYTWDNCWETEPRFEEIEVCCPCK